MKQITILLSLLIALFAISSTAQAGEWTSGRATNAAGSRNFSLWIPTGYDKARSTSLVVMLHGCMQKPADLATISVMNSVADKNNFLVVYPEQTQEANPLRCWNWFDEKHQARDAGEPSLIAAIVAKVSSTHKVDARRVYVAGISAGAAMAVVMGATYPDIFSAVGVMAGLAFKSGTSVETGLAAMKKGGPDPRQQGLLAFKAAERIARANSKTRMPVIVFHGEADPYLNVLNADQVIAQWAKTNDYLDDRKGNDSVKAEAYATTQKTIPDGYAYTRYTYNDRSNHLLMEKWIVKGLGHAWSGSPAATPFADPKGPNAAEEMWRFFSETNSRPTNRKTAKPKGAN